MTGDDSGQSGYVISVGARIRSIRRQKHLSLQDDEAASDHQFKASVLGAYERGERAISVPRLQRLARFYRVPVDQMLPPDDELGLPSANGDAPAVDVNDRPVTLNLQAIEQAEGHQGEMLNRYLRLIQWQRGDYNGRMLTIRRDDLPTLACILDCQLEQLRARLDSLGLLLSHSGSPHRPLSPQLTPPKPVQGVPPRRRSRKSPRTEAAPMGLMLETPVRGAARREITESGKSWLWRSTQDR